MAFGDPLRKTLDGGAGGGKPGREEGGGGVEAGHGFHRLCESAPESDGLGQRLDSDPPRTLPPGVAGGIQMEDNQPQHENDSETEPHRLPCGLC